MTRSYGTITGVIPVGHVRRKSADAAQLFRTVFIWPALLAAIVVLATSALIVSSHPALAQFVQQGDKLVGTGAVGSAVYQGNSVAFSADGNTAIVGGYKDNSDAGAAWVFVRSGGVWSQQGNKLIGTGAVGAAWQGYSVALSADGNTAIVGGYKDNSNAGAAWVFVRSGGVWSQQGSKLVGTGAAGGALQGASVALSSDGNTAIVGGDADNSAAGATWVYTRSGGVWSQQGDKLVGTGAAGTTSQGHSVALSADGNTAIVGAPYGSGIGATWVFIRSGGVWSQQGDKLVGTGAHAANGAAQGWSVALSSDGNTALVGGYFDDSYMGATWVFTRSGTVWTQQGSKLVAAGTFSGSSQGYSVALSADGDTALVGAYFGGHAETPNGAAWIFKRSAGMWSEGSKLVGTGAVGAPHQGTSVALSADGNTAIVGGRDDNGGVGAAWVFVQLPLATRTAMPDFNGDNKSDILWRNSDGTVAEWLLNGGTFSGLNVASYVGNDWHIVGSGDFDGDGKSDILWRHDDGSVSIWLMNANTFVGIGVAAGVSNAWHIDATGDFDGDGKSDILWRHDDGSVAIWLMNGGSFSGVMVANGVSNAWHITGVGDFDGDGKSDILWRASDGTVAVWLMNGATIASGFTVASTVPTAWQIAGVGDFNGDGKADILWRYVDGSVAMWLMNGGTIASGVNVISGFPTAWQIVGTGDFNGDGKSDILLRATDGSVAEWQMNGGNIASGIVVANGVPTSWATYQFPIVSAAGP